MRNITIAGIILLMLAFTISTGTAQSDNQTDTQELFDDIEDYQGSIGPGSALYGLKIAFEDLDETFTFNSNKKIDKKIAHAKLRIAEAKTELNNENTENAEIAFEKYREKIRETNESVTRFEGNDSGLLQAQEMIIKHQYVLERLLESHPNNTGLARAYDNSLRLEEKFEIKTKLKYERRVTEDKRVVLKKVRKVEIREKIEIKAEIIGNKTQVKVDVDFVSNETDRNAIAEEILKRMRLSRENITDLIEIEVEEDGKLEEILKAEARIEYGVSEVEAEFKFPLNATNETDIIDGTYERLSDLTVDEILNVLKIEVEEEKSEYKKEETKFRAEIVGDKAQVKVEVKFVSDSTEASAIAQEILNKLQLSRNNISGLLKIEGEEEELKQRLRAEADVKKGVTEVKAEYEFTLNATNKTDIVEGIYQKLATLTSEDIQDVLEIKTEKEDKIKEKEEKRVTEREPRETEKEPKKTEREPKETER